MMNQKREVIVKVASLFLCVVTSLFSFNVTADCRSDKYDSSGILKSIHDGDTLRLKDGRKIRLVGINTPEVARKGLSAEPFAVEATQYLKTILPVGKPVKLRFGEQVKDRYGRLLAHVFSEKGVNATAELIKKGYGFQVIIAPNDWSEACYQTLEQSVRKRKVGVWGHPHYSVKRAESTGLKSGFGVLSGEIERIVRTNKIVWIDLKGVVTLKVSQHHWEKFERAAKRLAVGRKIEVRGLLIDRKKGGKLLKKNQKRWLIPISHSAALTFLKK